MFRVTEIAYVPDGIRAVLVIDDPADLYYLRFIRQAERFAELFHHKLANEVGAHKRELDRPQRQEAARIERARLLGAFREMPGTRRERIRELWKMLRRQGREITQDGLAARIAIAIAEDRRSKAARIAELAAAGRSVRQISEMLNIPSATVSRLKKDAPEPPRTGDLDPPRTLAPPADRSGAPAPREATPCPDYESRTGP